MDCKQQIQKILDHPWIGMAGGFLLLVVAYKMNDSASNLILILSWIILVISIFFLEPIKIKPLPDRYAWTILIGLILGLLFYGCLWTHIVQRSKPGEAETTSRQTQKQAISNPTQSPSQQVGAASNATQNNNYSQNNFQSPSVNPNATFYAPQNINYNYYGVISNSVTREAFDALEAKLEKASTNIDLTRNDVRLLAQALRDLDQRTSDIEKLPDGRTKFGTVIVGTPKVVIESTDAGIYSLTNNDFHTALLRFKTAINAAESEQGVNGTLVSGEVTPEGFAQIYGLAAQAAQRLGSNSMANEYALKSVAKSPNSFNKALLATTLLNLSNDSFRSDDFSNAFILGQQAITNFESVEAGLTNFELSPDVVYHMYSITANSADRIGNTAQAKIYYNKAHQLEFIQESIFPH